MPRPAVDKAEAKSDRFAARRRALLEAQSARHGVEALAAAARRLDRPQKEALSRT